MSIKTIFLSSILTIIISIPLLAAAQKKDLYITNNTNQDSTSRINGFGCSADLPGGVTKAHSVNIVSEFLIKTACILDRVNCKAEIFMTANCTGPRIATVIFDINTGIKSVQMDSANYTIIGNGFDITLNGGPAVS